MRTKKFLTRRSGGSSRGRMAMADPADAIQGKGRTDAHQVKKGNTWHFGYKAHIGVDRDSGLVHAVEATSG